MPPIISVLKEKTSYRQISFQGHNAKGCFLFFSMFSNTSQAGMFYFHYYVHSKVVQIYLLA